MTNLFEQDRLKASYGKSLEGKSMPKGSFQRPRLVRKGSKEAAEDGPGAVQVKAETVLACAGFFRQCIKFIIHKLPPLTDSVNTSIYPLTD